MRKKQKRLEIGNQDRLNSDFATLVVLGSYFPSSKVVLFLYPCSSVCIRGFKTLTRRTPADIAAAILAEAGRAGAGAPAPRRGIPRATAPRGARVRAGRNRVGDSRCESRVRHAGACQRILPVRAASNRLLVWTMVSRRARASSPGVLGAIRMHVPFSPPRPMRPRS